jgi:hypothetical protein
MPYFFNMKKKKNQQPKPGGKKPERQVSKKPVKAKLLKSVKKPTKDLRSPTKYLDPKTNIWVTIIHYHSPVVAVGSQPMKRPLMTRIRESELFKCFQKWLEKQFWRVLISLPFTVPFAVTVHKKWEIIQIWLKHLLH